jgi:hypothetical protein
MTQTGPNQAPRTPGEIARNPGVRRLSLTIDARRRLNTPPADDRRQLADRQLGATRLGVPVVIARLQRSNNAASQAIRRVHAPS